MRWVGVVAVVLALVAVAALPAGPAPLAPGEAAAADCVWKKRQGKQVKQVRHKGRARRTVRRKSRWVCVPKAAAPIIAAPAPAPASPVSSAPGPAPEPQPEPEPTPEPEANRLAVKSAEYFYVLSRPTVSAGKVTIELNNRGEDPHNLNIRREGEEGVAFELPETDSLQRSVAGFDLPAGSYRLWCSLPEHEEKGMYTTLQVE
jgi:hypothetical protein